MPAAIAGVTLSDLLNAAKIVKREPARDGGPVVLKPHARAQIAVLHSRGADTLGIVLADCNAL